MTPINFPEANADCNPAPIVVTAWMPTAEEREALALGGPVFISFIGGLPPHLLTTSFEAATTIA